MIIHPLFEQENVPDMYVSDLEAFKLLVLFDPLMYSCTFPNYSLDQRFFFAAGVR